MARKGTKKSLTSKKATRKRSEHASSVTVGDEEVASRAKVYRQKWCPLDSPFPSLSSSLAKELV